jgi:hypothetical protein
VALTHPALTPHSALTPVQGLMMVDSKA